MLFSLLARDPAALGGILWGMLGDTTVRGTVLILCAAGVVRLWPGASAAHRHLVWTVTCCSLLALPILQLVTPSWTLRVLPPTTQPASNDRLPLLAGLPLFQARGSGGALGATRSPGNERTVKPTSEGAGSLWSLFVLGVWGSGALVVLASLLRSQRRLRRFVSATTPVTDPRVCAIFAKLGRESRRVAGVPLRQHPLAVPMVYGLVQPVIVLPSSASEWEEARLRNVLLHEIAHVKRFDNLSQAAASLACLVYWFNPLAWLVARMLRTERERACDDAVLAAGSAPSAYATDLLELAQLLHPVRGASLAALTFARPSQLPLRLRAVIDARCHRAGVSRRNALLTWSAAFGVVYPLVGVSLQPRMRHQHPSQDSPPMKHANPVALAAATLTAVTPAPRAPYLPGATPFGTGGIAQRMTRTNMDTAGIDTGKTGIVKGKIQTITYTMTADTVPPDYTGIGIPMTTATSDADTPRPLTPKQIAEPKKWLSMGKLSDGNYPEIQHHFNCRSPDGSKVDSLVVKITLTGDPVYRDQWLNAQDSLTVVKNDRCKLMKVDTVKSL